MRLTIVGKCFLLPVNIENIHRKERFHAKQQQVCYNKSASSQSARDAK